MNTNRLLEIGQTLAKLLQDRAQATLDEWKAGQDIAARQLELTPAEGWLGKNAEARNDARDKAFAEDETLWALEGNKNDAHARVTLTGGEIEALEAERRSLEWAIRAQLVQALYTNGVQTNGNGGPVSDTAFDDAAGQAMDQEAFYDGLPPEPEPMDLPDIPF